MKTKVWVFALAIISVVALSILAGCGGDHPEENPIPTASIQVMLVDAPADRIEELHLQLKSVQLVNHSGPIVEVLGPNDLPDDVEVIGAAETPIILGTVDVPAGTYTFANLQIEPNSPVNRLRTSDGQVHPINYTPPRDQTANLGGTIVIEAGSEMTLLLDFAAAASVRETPNGWVLNPRIFTRYIERGVDFGSLRGVVREIDGEPLVAPPGQILGVFFRDQETGDSIALSEIDGGTGEFQVPTIVPGRYRLKVQFATPDWEPVGQPFVDNIVVRVRPGQDVRTAVDIDL